jgi:23S rRNA pseudouridine1911/1915/1917 synthase
VADSQRRTYRLRTTVHHSLRDRSALDFLTLRFRYLGRDVWEERLRNGLVRVNGTVAGPEVMVRRDDVVEYTVEIDEPDVDASYDTVYEDDHLLIVSKSGNIPVHASGRFIGNTLIATLRAERGRELALSHRLDRETSGLIVATRTPEARRGMADAFESGSVRKTYLAAVRGLPSTDGFTIDAPLGRIGRQHPVPRSVVDRKAGRRAVTRFQVVERFRDAALVLAEPRTGRTNQVRAHLEIAGHPIIGDKSYGIPARLLHELLADPASPRVRQHLRHRRHALHASRLTFRHPVTGVALDIATGLPVDLRVLFEALRREHV